MVTLARELREGGSFTAFTVRLKLVVVVPPSLSVAVMVMVAVPLALVRGRMVRVRFGPAPSKLMLADETSPVFEEAPVTVRLAAGVSTSPTVKLIVIGASSSVV